MKQSKEPLNIKSVKRETLSSQVIDQIIDLLLSGQLGPGDKLPSEMELLETFGVSRPVLREAISSLETIGLVQRKTREGTYFTDRIGSRPFQIMLSLTSGNIRSIMETRISQEIGLVTLAAEKITNGDLKKLNNTIEQMEGEKAGITELDKLDKEFHRIIAYSASNPIIEGIIDPLLNIMERTMENVPTEDRDPWFTIKQHKDIYLALEKGDSTESYLSMYEHLNHVRKRIVGF